MNEHTVTRVIIAIALIVVAYPVSVIPGKDAYPHQNAAPAPAEKRAAYPGHIAFNVLNTSNMLAEYPDTGHGRSMSEPRTSLSKPDGIDLDVTYISRSPLYNRHDVWYTGEGKPYLRPGSENDQRWPENGELVTFTAHIRNKGTVASGSFDFKWFIDGTEVNSGSHGSLDPGEEGLVSYQWIWSHSLNGERLLGSHTVRFTVDPDNLITETYETNNSIEDRTDALSLVLALTPELYAALETPVDPKWPFSAEDWLQKQIAAMNAAFERSIYASAPNGIEERVRLDKIVITSSSPATDWNEDGGFFISQDDRSGNAYYDPEEDVSGSLIHELTHQLGIIDMYNLDVPLEVPQVIDQIGKPIQMEYSSSFLFPGLMNNPGITPPIYDEHTSLALNANKGYRRGYYGEYLYDVPKQTYLRALDNEGNPAGGVTVNLYQRSSDPNLYGGKFGIIDNAPEFTGTTDPSGSVLLANRSAGTPVTTQTGHTLLDNPFGIINVVGINDEFILALSKGAHQEYQLLDITRFNLSFWRGSSDDATMDIPSHVPPDNAPSPPINLTGLLESGQVKLEWGSSPSSSVIGYNVYKTTGPAYTYQKIITETTNLSFTDDYDANARAASYAITAVDTSGRESGFSKLFYAFRLINPADILVDEQGDRLVLDPQNGYALLYQSSAGTFLDTRGSYDFHLEYSQYISQDPLGNLIISHPGDYYSTHHSVLVADKDGNPLFEFGEQGSAAGQFKTVAGVASWSETCDATGNHNVNQAATVNSCDYRILVADSGNHRIQAFDASGNFFTAYGSLGSGSAQFSGPRGLDVNSNGQVIIADSGNDRLQLLDFNGSGFSFIRSITGNLSGPTGVAAYGSNHFVVADTGNNKVKVFNSNGDLIYEYSAPTDEYSGSFNQPEGVAADTRGNIIVSDTGNQRVVTIVGVLPVEASFIATPTTGSAPLLVNFSNTSLGNITDVHWNFGDGSTSSQNNPTHTYTEPGPYTVSLTVSGPSGSDTRVESGVIHVSPKPKELFIPIIRR